MEKLKFSVTGSKGDLYTVIFERSNNNLNAFCDCQAGQNGMYCKHRFSLMDGEVKNIASDNIHDLEKLKKLLENTDVLEAYNAVNSAQKEADKAKLILQKTKKALAKAMYN